MLSVSQSEVRFDYDSDGSTEHTSWFALGDGMLFLYRNGDGTVSNADEFSFINDLVGARSDLEGLRAFESNAVGIFSASDEQFAAFRIWADNGDGAAVVSEIITLSQAGIASLSLTAVALNGSAALGDVIVLGTRSYQRTDSSEGNLLDTMLAYMAAGSEADTDNWWVPGDDSWDAMKAGTDETPGLSTLRLRRCVLQLSGEPIAMP